MAWASACAAVTDASRLISRWNTARNLLGPMAPKSTPFSLAAAALYALGNHRSRLVEDHEHAKLFAHELRGSIENTRASAQDPETNIVNIDVQANVAPQVAAAAKENGVLLGAIGPSRLRAVFHLEITRDASVTAAQALAQAIRAICSVD